jgi:hypothetical protein
MRKLRGKNRRKYTPIPLLKYHMERFNSPKEKRAALVAAFADRIYEASYPARQRC